MDEKKPMTQDIRGAVKDGLANAKNYVRDKLIDQLAQAELDKRVKASASVFEKLEAAELELRKIRPASTGFNVKGEPVGELVFTKDQVEQIKKINEQVEKLNKALENALYNGDFSKVFDLAK